MVITALLLDKDFVVQAVLNNKISWGYNRAVNKATGISVSIPREDLSYTSKSNLISIAQYIQIYSNGIYTIGGRVTQRDISDDVVDISAFTEEIKMESVICPPQYTRKYEGWDLADVVRDLSKGWSTQRIKSTSQWNSAVASANIDFTTLTNQIILTKYNGVYNVDGYATYRFLSADIPNFTSWDRIRWVSDNLEPIITTIQYRYGETWFTSSAWSTPITGASTDTLGLDISTLTSPVLEVRINLHTNDVTSEDTDGNKMGSSPVVFALEVLSRTNTYIGTTNIPASTGKLVSGLVADSNTAFELLISACEIADWEFEVRSNEIHIANRLGSDLTGTFVFKKNENIWITELSDTDDDLVNVVHASGTGDGINRLTVSLKDSTSINLYGEYPEAVAFDTEDLVELTSLAQAYLDAHKIIESDWKVETFEGIDNILTSSITIEGTQSFEALYSSTTFTVPPLDAVEQNLASYKPTYRTGDTVRIVDPVLGTITDSRILEETREGNSNGIKTTLFLNKPRGILATRIAKPTEAKALSAPVSITVSPIIGGITVTVPAPNEGFRWATTEIYMSETTPVDTSTSIKLGRNTSFDISGLNPNKRYYFIARYIDTNQRVSGSSIEVSGMPAFVEVKAINVMTGFGMKSNLPSNGYVTLCGANIEGVLSATEGGWLTYAGGSLMIKYQAVSTIDDKLNFIVVDDAGNAKAVYFNAGYYRFYDYLGVDVMTGWIIGTAMNTTGTITSTTNYEYAKTIEQGKTEQASLALTYLNKATTQAEFETIVSGLGMEYFFSSLAVYKLFVDSIMTNTLEVKEVLYAGYAENGDAPADGSGFWLHKSGLLRAKNAELIGTLRTGANAPTDACVGIQDSSGITSGPTFTGTGLNDLLITQDGAIEGDFQVMVDTPTDFSNSGIQGSWSAPISDGTNGWEAITVNSTGRFVAVGSVGNISYSDDSITWATPFTVGTRGWNGITVNSTGRFVTVGYAGNISYSDDGITWSTPVVIGVSWYAITVNSTGRFVAVGYGGNISYSDDGITWSTPVVIGVYGWEAITVNSTGRFVAVGTLISYSDNGITWATPFAVESISWRGITVNSTGRFVSVGYVGNISYSDDGITWSTPVVITDKYWNGITVNSTGRFVTVGYGGIISYSNNGISWSIPAVFGNSEWNAITVNSTGRFVAVGYDLAIYNGSISYTLPQDSLAWSHDAGLTWESNITIPLSKTITLPGYDINILFSSAYNHTVGSYWVFIQDAMRGIAILDVAGNEYFSTYDGKVKMTLPPSALGLPTGSLWNDAGTLKIVL